MIRVAVLYPNPDVPGSFYRDIVDVPVANIHGAQEVKDGAMRLADWARKQPGVGSVTRKEHRVLITMKE